MVHNSILLYVSRTKVTTVSMIVILSIMAAPTAKILAWVARTTSSFVCMARYLGKAWIDAAPVARPEHADSTEDLRDAASEAVEERFWMRWAMVRISGSRAGVRVVKSSRGGRVRYGLRGVVGAAGAGAEGRGGYGVKGVGGRVEEEW